MQDRVKNALKRAASGLLAVLLALCLVGTPRSKAVVSEGALLGSLFGSLLVSMGYSWAADNFDVPTFGEAIYDLIKQCDQEKDTGIQLLLDSNLAGLTAVGNGKLTFSQQWVNLAKSFADWFEQKFFASGNSSALVHSNAATCNLKSGSYPYFTCTYNNWGTSTGVEWIDLSYFSNFVTSSLLSFPKSGDILVNDEFSLHWFSKEVTTGIGLQTQYTINSIHNGTTIEINKFMTQNDVHYGFTSRGDRLALCLYYDTNTTLKVCPSASYDEFGSVKHEFLPLLSALDLASPSSLTAEKPAEVHYPVVAEDGSQVYEITVDGVTATDIEGIIQGAVDRILAGTATIVGSVEQAGTGEEVANPVIDPYKVSLSSVFPFCIPFDVYNMVTMLVAEPEAPNAEWTFTLPWSGQEYNVGWDLAAFDGVARVCRDMELVLFAVGLAVITYKVIKW